MIPHEVQHYTYFLEVLCQYIIAVKELSKYYKKNIVLKIAPPKKYASNGILLQGYLLIIKLLFKYRVPMNKA